MASLVINGTSLHYQEAGIGPPLLFFHATPASGSFFLPQLEAFSQRYRAITFDLRGHGESDKPEGDYAIETFLADYHAIVDRLSLPPLVLVGCSLGGIVGQLFALERPEALRALVLIGSPSSRRGRDVAGFKRAVGEIGWGAMVERLLRKQLHSTAPAPLIDWARTEYLKTPLHVRLAEEEALLAVHHSERLAELRMPVLLVYGEEEEEEIATQMRVAGELIPDAEVHCIPGASHYPNLERPQAFNSILASFLTRIGHG